MHTFLESFFPMPSEYDFTAGLEEQLDLISNNEIAWREVLKDFWRDFIGAVDDIKDLKISQVIDALDVVLYSARLCFRRAPMAAIRANVRPAAAAASR